MSDETPTTEPTETPDAPEADAETEAVETEEGTEAAAAPEPEQSAVARVALKTSRAVCRSPVFESTADQPERGDPACAQPTSSAARLPRWRDGRAFANGVPCRRSR